MPGEGMPREGMRNERVLRERVLRERRSSIRVLRLRAAGLGPRPEGDRGTGRHRQDDARTGMVAAGGKRNGDSPLAPRQQADTPSGRSGLSGPKGS